MLLRHDPHDVDLRGARVVLLQRQKARVADGERLQPADVPDVGGGRVLEAEPVRERAEDALADPRTLVGALDALDVQS
jgi:hypothetical protein